jgi:hypothetical protein
MSVYSYITTMPGAQDTIEGIIFYAGVPKDYSTDQYVLNKYVPSRLDRFFDGVKSNTDLVVQNTVYNQERYDAITSLGLSPTQAAQLQILLNGSSLDGSNGLVATYVGSTNALNTVVVDGVTYTFAYLTSPDRIVITGSDGSIKTLNKDGNGRVTSVSFT